MLKYHEIQMVRKSCTVDEQRVGKRKGDRTLDQVVKCFCQRGIIYIQTLLRLVVVRDDFRYTLMALIPQAGADKVIRQKRAPK